MFDSLGKGLSGLIRKLTTGTSVDKKLVEEILNDLKILLLQSDVDIKLADELVSNVRRKTLEEKTPAGLTLREHVLKTIYEELVKLLGENPAPLMGKKRIMFVGLFGSGKTTTIGKLSKSLMKQGLKPALVALDYHRPAAPQQLEQLGKQIGVPVHINSNKNPYEAAAEGMKKLEKYDTVIFDTAGRNALDKELAEELKKLTEIIKPDEVLLVIPADLGKVAKVQAEEFHKLAGVTGVVISKMDGTAKAGGALAAASVTGAKVKFIGVGEKIDDLESYDPKRFVSRLLGLGDLETLLEKAKEVDIKKESVEKIVKASRIKRIAKGSGRPESEVRELLDQYEKMKKMMKMLGGQAGLQRGALKNLGKQFGFK